ncbi:MAG: hypothetical protein EB829_04490 [Nitrosopumilus sp. H8]|nr:MAG: hypothetical protein EB829_04490 [Nitrosopumilus sp. H8]
MQDMQIYTEQRLVQSSATAAECYVCGKRFDEGHRITAKTMVHGTFLLCSEHYSLKWIVKPEPPVQANNL